MGGMFHLFDFHQGSMARKIPAQKKYVGVLISGVLYSNAVDLPPCSLEAPRNSLELQLETSQSYHAAGDLLYSYQVEEDWAAKNCYQTEASMKKLISEEMSRQSNTRQNTPSIVAKLMGMDALPLDTKFVVQPAVRKNDKQQVKFSEREKNAKVLARLSASNSNYSKQMEVDSICSGRDRDAERWNTSHKFGEPRPSEHPQEEVLQKFKEEFEAWQAARLRECSKVVDVGSISTHQLAQEKLNKEKTALYADSLKEMHEKPLESKRFTIKENLHGRVLQHHRHKSELFTDQQKESRRQSMNKNFQLPSMIDYNEKVDAAPTRIVILKPGPDRICGHEESCTSSSRAFEERARMEAFLEEVRERLKLELQGKDLKKSSVVRGTGIETPFSERPSDPRQIAKHIAKQVGEKVIRDLGMNLVQSESTRSYRSDIQFNGSPEFINKDTRRFLSERLRNVLKQETQLELPIVSTGCSRSSVFDNGRDGIKRIQDVSKSGNKQNYWEIVKDCQDMQTSSFRHGDDFRLLNRELAPRNLIRSLSAPVSGTSFGKLLLEDRHILTGVQIRRKHEGTENVSVDIRKRKKEKFNLKEKVSNIKYGLTLRQRLFGKKIQSMAESYGSDNGPAEDIFSGPTVIMNFGERHENSTEVPPSPASVCSSTYEEIWRQVDHLSAISTPDVTLGEDNAVPQVFKEISSNLNELRWQLNELESDGANGITIEQEHIESEMVDLEGHAERYVRDLLVASGLYDGSCDKSFSRWAPLAKPISNSVFEQVEEFYSKLAKESDGTRNDQNEKVDHKVLLGLLNEALSAILGPPVTVSRFRRKLLGSSTLPPPQGRKLLNSVWDIIRINLYPPNDRFHYSLDSMVARYLGSIPWSGLVDDETNVLGKEVECHIIGDLVEEIVKDMHL